MKEFVLIFRLDITTPSAQPTAEEMEKYMVSWMNWLDKMASKDQLVSGGNHLSYSSAKVVRADKQITDGPYVSEKESVAGYIIIRAAEMDEAVRFAEECPILSAKIASVEVRETATPGN